MLCSFWYGLIFYNSISIISFLKYLQGDRTLGIDIRHIEKLHETSNFNLLIVFISEYRHKKTIEIHIKINKFMILNNF